MVVDSVMTLGPEPIDRIALAIDTSSEEEAQVLMRDFKSAGGTIVKLGLEAQSTFYGPQGLSQVAYANELDWVYDGKIKDIKTTMANAIKNIANLAHPPIAMTMHADTSRDGMRMAQEAAGNIPMLGVTLLTDISPTEAYKDYSVEEDREKVEMGIWTPEQAGEIIRVRQVLKRGRKLGEAGVMGLVASAKELQALMEDDITQPMIKMIPGTRSRHAQANDQKNVLTPEEAMARGADLLVIGRQYTEAEDKPAELSGIRSEMGRGMERRAA